MNPRRSNEHDDVDPLEIERAMDRLQVEGNVITDAMNSYLERRYGTAWREDAERRESEQAERSARSLPSIPQTARVAAGRELLRRGLGRLKPVGGIVVIKRRRVLGKVGRHGLCLGLYPRASNPPELSLGQFSNER